MKISAIAHAGMCMAAVCPSTLAQESTTNGTVVSATNSTNASIRAGWWRCIFPPGGLTAWYYQTWSNGPYDCSDIDHTQKWSMLRAYRSGGQEGVHWKYTNDENDGACLTNWVYYTADGQTWQATIPRTTTFNDNRRWCALPVYRQGGVQGKQWERCRCVWTEPIEH